MGSLIFPRQNLAEQLLVSRWGIQDHCIDLKTCRSPNQTEGPRAVSLVIDDGHQIFDRICVDMDVLTYSLCNP